MGVVYLALDPNGRAVAIKVQVPPGLGASKVVLAYQAQDAEVFLARGQVAVNSGPTFGTGGAGHVRLNLATSPEILTEAVRRMAASV